MSANTVILSKSYPTVTQGVKQQQKLYHWLHAGLRQYYMVSSLTSGVKQYRVSPYLYNVLVASNPTPAFLPLRPKLEHSPITNKITLVHFSSV